MRHPPPDTCVCGGCGTPYAMNGDRSTTLVEIDVQAHTRRIVRPRWRRACDCEASPREVSAAAPKRLFERYVCHRPLNGVAAWVLFGGAAPGTVLVCDRYSAYKKLAKDLAGVLTLSFCWAHRRRDFIDCAAGQSDLTDWCQAWLVRIASIYRLNKKRLSHYEPGLEPRDGAFEAAQRALETDLEGLFDAAERELAALDKTAREAGPRFTATMYSVLNTLAMNGIDVRGWLNEWLAACAGHAGQAPPDLAEWLPWSMNEARRRTLMAPQ